MNRFVLSGVIYTLPWTLVDALLFGLACYGFLNLLAHFIPVTDLVVGPAGCAIIGGLLFSGKFLAKICQLPEF